MIQLPRFQKTDIGWLTTLPEQYGTFLGKPIDICIGDFNFRRAQPHPDMVAPIVEILEELPVILKQAEKALRAKCKKDPDMWPQMPDPCLCFHENFWDTADWIFAVEAVDNLGASWDIEFTGNEYTGIHWAQD